MKPNSNELSALVKALAKAFPSYEARIRLAGKAAVASKAQVVGDTDEAWRDIVHCAQEEGSLDVLVQAAFAEQPDNKEIALFLPVDDEVTAAVLRQSKGHLWVGLALLLAGTAAYFFKKCDSDPLTAAEVTEPARVAKVLVPEPEPDLELKLEPEPVPDPVLEPVLEPEPVFAPESDPAAEPEPESEINGRCGGSKGSLVGYFYAGDSFGGAPGSAYTMNRDVNVRADYPHKENGWSSQSKKRCVLVRGDVLLLSAPAIAVDGGKVWVPLYAGDLQKR